MKYYILLKIAIEESPFFIQVGLNYDLSFHPNTTDNIMCADYECKIAEIYYCIDNLDYITIRMDAIDGKYLKGNCPEEDHKLMQEEWKDLKEWCDSNDDRIILNDYFMNPNNDFDNNRIIKHEEDKKDVD